MTYKEWCSLNDYEEIDRFSDDNHIYHIVQVEGKKIEIDEDLQSMQIAIEEVKSW